MTTEQKRILDNMLKERLESRGATDTEAGAIQQILALASSVPDGTLMRVDTHGTGVDARTVRVWAASYFTPETKQ